MASSMSELGPLAVLLGKWRGESGEDISPEPGGTEENSYYETLEFKAIPDVENAEEQVLKTVQYELLVQRKNDDKVLHHQLGYWTWDKETELVCNGFTIARRVAVLAGGTIENTNGEVRFSVSATKGNERWGIIESEFMNKKASTTGFSQVLTVVGDTLNYEQTTLVNIYGTKQFEHKDANTLKRI